VSGVFGFQFWFQLKGSRARAVPGLLLMLPAQEADGSFRNSNFLVKE
jgi:hypothetical protein